MNKTLATLFTLTAVAVLPLYVCADEGKTPIYDPDTTITESGSYIVTRDITATDSPAISIVAPVADVSVTIDLNGYTVTGAAGQPVVDASGFFDIFLTNGTLSGGSNGFRAKNGGVKARVRIENLVIANTSGHGIHVETDGGGFMNVKASRVSSAGGNGIFSGPATPGPAASTTVDIVDNTIEDAGADGIALSTIGPVYVGDNTLRDIANTGVRITGAQGAVIENNQIFNIGTGEGDGEAAIRIVGLGPEWGNQIRGNTLSGGGGGGSAGDDDSVGIYVGPNVQGNILSENTIGGGIPGNQFTNGIMVASSGNTIRLNNVGGSAGDGISVTGSNNIVRENQCQSNEGTGVNATGGGNYIIDNMLVGNTTPASGVVDPSGNTDDGGNYVN
jgi:parallel beta-helix repeat protein